MTPLHQDEPPIGSRPVARLENGAWLVPGETTIEGVEHCAGPDWSGRCPEALAGRTPMCEGAIWFPGGPDRRGYSFRPSNPGGAACPAALMDPLAQQSQPA